MEKGEKGLSAGRVQSVALRMIIDRENEIKTSNQKNIGQLKERLKKEKII